MFVTAGWLVLLFAVAVLEAIGRASGAVEAPSRTLARIGRTAPGRLLLVACWGFVGWHVFSRYTIGPL